MRGPGAGRGRAGAGAVTRSVGACCVSVCVYEYVIVYDIDTSDIREKGNNSYFGASSSSLEPRPSKVQNFIQLTTARGAAPDSPLATKRAEPRRLYVMCCLE